MQAIILAAGLGTRLRPHTFILPKPLIPLANIPLLEYHLQWLKDQGAEQAAVNLHYLPHKIPATTGSGQRWGLDIKYAWEPVILGTGGGIKQLGRLLGGANTLAAINGDMLCNADLGPAMELHRQRGALATMLLTREAQVSRFGGVGLDSKGRVRQISDRIPNAPPDLEYGVFAGIHLLEPELLEHIPDGEVCINAQVYPELIRQGKPIYGYFIPENFFWRHLGSQPEYLGVNEELLAGQLPLPLPFPQTQPGIWVDGPVLIEPGAQLVPPVAIGRYSRIESSAVVGPGVSIGRGCTIAAGCRIRHSILWDGIRLEPGTSIDHTVLSS